MRRVLVVLAGSVLLLLVGCGLHSYELRLTQTLDHMKYQERLNRMLQPPLTKGKWEELSVYLRPPKTLVQAKEWQLSPTEPGKFDLEASLLEAPKQSMHVLVRRKRAKPTGKTAPTAADT